MSRCLSAIVFACLSAAVVAAPANDEKKSPAADAERLVQQLGSSKHADREAAAKALDALGVAALTALREGARNSDPEIRRRAGDLLAKLDRQAASAAAMMPTKVHLKAVDAPLADVVRDLGKQANVRFQIAREPVDLAARHVTVDIADASFWEALDALCHTAKVSIRPSTLDPSVDEQPAGIAGAGVAVVPGGVVQLNAAGGVMFASSAVGPSDEPLVLQDGALPLNPTAILGASRVRLIPDRWANRDRKPGDEVRWTLEIMTEPRMRWVGQPSVRFDARPGVHVDPTPQGGDGGNLPIRNRPIVLGGGGVIGIAGNVARGVTRFELPVYVKADGGKAISDLKGSLAGTVQAASGAVATIADVTKEKASASTKDDVKVTVREYSKADDGTVSLTVEMEGPATVAARAIALGAANVAVNRIGRAGGVIPPNIARMVSGPDGMVESIKLTDEKGRPYEISMTKSELSQKNGAMSATLTLECQPPAADAKPKVLELHGPRTVAVEAAFTFHDVPAVQ